MIFTLRRSMAHVASYRASTPSDGSDHAASTRRSLTPPPPHSLPHQRAPLRQASIPTGSSFCREQKNPVCLSLPNPSAPRAGRRRRHHSLPMSESAEPRKGYACSRPGSPPQCWGGALADQGPSRRWLWRSSRPRLHPHPKQAGEGVSVLTQDGPSGGRAGAAPSADSLSCLPPFPR